MGDHESDEVPVPPRHAAPGEVVESLVALRAWAGSPSFTEIARRVTAARTSRGVPVVEARLARSTAYDCFRHGRRRIDVDLVLEIVRALGVAETDARRWRAALTTPPGRTGGVGVEVRRGLPRTESLVGRDEEVERAVMADGATLITGMAGVGKTALALAVAKRLVDSAAVDDVLVARLDGHAQSDDPAALDALLGLLAEEIGELDGAPRSAEPAGRRVARLLTQARLVLVLDNAADTADLLPLVRLAGSSRIIITSRRRGSPGHLTEIALRELDPRAGAHLLERESKGELPASEESTVRLAETLGGLPLALALAGRRAAQSVGWSATDHLEAFVRRAALLDLDEPVAEVVSQSYEAQPARARRILRLASVAPGTDVSSEALAVLVDGAEDAVERDVRRLVEVHLMRPSGDGRWDMHDLVRVFARGRSAREDAPSAVAAARTHLLEHHLERASSCVATTHPHEVGSWWWLSSAPPAVEQGGALAWLSTERATLVEAALSADELGRPELGAALAAVLVPYLWDRSEPGRVLELAEHGLHRAGLAGNQRGTAVLERLVGQTFIRAGRYDRARDHLARALAAAQTTGTSHDVALTHNALAIIASADGDTDAAVRHSHEALSHFRAHPEDGFVCGVLNNLAIYHFEAGDQDAALRVFEEVVALAVEHGWLTREQWALSNMSEILVGLGRLDDAAAAVARAGALAVELDDAVGHAYVLTNRALVEHTRGQTQAAVTTSRQAVDRGRALGHPSLEASALCSLGRYLADAGDLDGAAAAYRQSLQVATRIGEAHQVTLAVEGLRSLGLDP